MRRLIRTLGLCFTTFFIVGPAAANGCFGAGQPLFHCTFKNGAKALDICLQGDLLLYRYGALAGKAELLLASRVENTHMRPWNGVGSSIYEEASFANGDVTYTAFYAVARIAADAPDVSGGIIVTKGDQTLANLTCDSGSIEPSDFYPIFEEKNAQGQCWNTDTFTWGGC